MKKYSFKVRAMRDADSKIVRFKEELDVLVTSERFTEEFRGYIEDIARFRTINGRKSFRSTDYAAIGILDINDVYQEAYLAFFEAYNSYKDKSGDFEDGAAVWSYLKKSTILNLDKSLRGKKDGIKTPERVLFQEGGVNVNLLTSLFDQMERAFSNNIEEVAMTKWETELVGMFLEVHMDEFLDLTREGNRDFKKQERNIMKALYGIDQPSMTYKEASEYFKINQSTLRKVKERAIVRLQSDESKYKIGFFLREYRIKTGANVDLTRNIKLFSDVVSQNEESVAY